jgi:hypothetical protein
MKKNIIDAAGDAASRIDWPTVDKVIRERKGIPVLIAAPAADDASAKPRKVKSFFN